MKATNSLHSAFIFFYFVAIALFKERSVSEERLASFIVISIWKICME
jgi:hypothetical protein